MPRELLFGLPIGLIIVISAFAAVVAAPRLGVPIRILALLLLLPVACFCVFGFAASFEPGDFHVVWRVLYAVVFLACLAGSARLVFVKRDTSNSTQD